MRIPDTKIDEIRSASDIVDIVSSYVRLRKRGKNFIGLCPFHQEKTPSFNVSPDKQMYYCFGCGNGGNVITFVSQLEKVSFIEAVRSLADRVGISLPSENAADSNEATESERLYEVCRKAGRFFYENLTTTIEGKLALEYFHHRGFTDETIRKFGLGYAMNSWDGIMKRMEGESISLELLDKAGLVVRREDGSGYYDRFRGRAMFPIFSPTGRTVAFGARKMREDDPLGKYINSPETPIYSKSRLLYGLYQAKEAIREQENAILVEGYADLISVFQSGIRNVVASSGTALTEEQIQQIGRYAQSITIVYDADSAGSKASLRGVDLVVEQGLEVKVAELPPGEDPDSFVRKHGGKAFQELLDGAVSFLDHQARSFQAEGLFNTPEGQTHALRSIVGTISKMKDELKRAFYIKSVSEKYGIYESLLYRELERILGKERNRSRFSERRESLPSLDETKVVKTTTEPVAKELPSVERDLLKLMLEHGNEMVGFVFSHVERESFTHPMAQRLVKAILGHAEGEHEWDVNTLIGEVTDADFRQFVANLVFSKYEISKGWETRGSAPEEPDPGEIAERCINIIRRQQIDVFLAENQRLMKDASARGESVRDYMEHHQMLMNEKRKIEQNLLSKKRVLPQ